jgi:hypothetical protein
MKPKTKKILIITSVIAAIAIAMYYYYLSTQTEEFPYTDEKGITYFSDGSYSYVLGPNIVTQHPDGLTTVSSNPDYESEAVDGNPYIPNIPGAGNFFGINLA